MPPRLSLVSSLRALDISGSSLGPSLPRVSSAFVPSTVNSTQTRKLSDEERKKRRLNDPYIRAQIEARKAAFRSWREETSRKKAQTLGDPVRGVSTPFVESFDTTLVSPPSDPSKDTESLKSKNVKGSARPRRNDPSQLVTAGVPDPSLPYMHSVQREELREVIKDAKDLALPVNTGVFNQTDKDQLQEEIRLYGDQHSRAERAINRILNLATGSAQDRMQANKFRCVEEFGRHRTDNTLPARPGNTKAIHEEKQRGGPDTGSSEVQIAILTAKIRALADSLEYKSKKDKHNKRNLRLLVHRRQKLLKYLQRKEKGGPRWQHCIEKLGLTPASWQGEISL